MKAVSIKACERIEMESDSIYLYLQEMFLNDQKARKSVFNKKAKMKVADSVNNVSSM